MARCPFANWRPIPENATQADITPTQVILHTAVDAPGETDLYGYFARGDVGVETHFFIQNDGDIIQYMDTAVRADGNRYANVRAISVETEDDGAPRQTPWTAAQLSSIKRLLAWLMGAHPGIQRRVCPAWDAAGVGYHTMWGAPSEWTPVSKDCPGPIRIAQFNADIVPWLEHEPVTPKPQTEEEDDDMKPGFTYVPDKKTHALRFPDGCVYETADPNEVNAFAAVLDIFTEDGVANGIQISRYKSLWKKAHAV